MLIVKTDWLINANFVDPKTRTIEGRLTRIEMRLGLEVDDG